MSNKYNQRQFNKIIELVAKKNKIKYECYCDGWVIHLTKNNKNIYAYGYNFPCNNYVSAKICNDKSATCEILKKNNILCFEHSFISNETYCENDLLKLFNKYNKNIIIKPNEGSGGRNIFHLNNFSKLKIITKQLLTSNHGIAISPFYKYDKEYRIYFYNDKNYISYSKEIVDKNEWKHNLCLGAKINTKIEKNILNKLIKIGKDCIDLLKLNVCAVDFAIIDNNIYVVEINNGVMLEVYSKFNSEAYKKSYNFINKIIIDAFKNVK